MTLPFFLNSSPAIIVHGHHFPLSVLSYFFFLSFLFYHEPIPKIDAVSRQPCLLTSYMPFAHVYSAARFTRFLKYSLGSLVLVVPSAISSTSYCVVQYLDKWIPIYFAYLYLPRRPPRLACPNERRARRASCLGASRFSQVNDRVT